MSANECNILQQEISKASVTQLQKSIEMIGCTLKFVVRPDDLKGLKGLPERNKKILLDLAMTFVEEGRKEFISLVDELKEDVGFDENRRPFDSSAELINWGFQIGQRYEQYTQSGHFEYIQSLIDCLIYSRGEEILQRSPVIPIDNLRIIARASVAHEKDDCSRDLLDMLKRFSASMEI